MRIFCMSQTGYGLGIAAFLSSEGHVVSTHITTADDTPRVRGLLRDRIPDIAILDSPEHTETAEWIRSRGVKVLGDSKWSYLLSTNKEYRQNIIKAIGYKLGTGGEKGIPAVVSCWFNGHRFISKTLVFNYVRFMAGDVGVDVPSAGYIAYFNTERSRLVQEVLRPLEKFLRKANHRGCFSVEVLVDSGQWVVRDISASVCQPFSQAIFENTRSSKSDVLLSIFDESSKEVPHVSPYVCGCMLSVYPYPFAQPATTVGISGLNQFNLRHIWLMDCVSSNDKWTTGEHTGCLGYVIARGSTVQEARRRVYRTISNLEIDGIQYRNDIGKDTGASMYQLKKQKLI